jgi:hypothetical protein
MITIQNDSVVAVESGSNNGKTIFKVSDGEPAMILTERKISGFKYPIYISDEDWEKLK